MTYTFEDNIKTNSTILQYIKAADLALQKLGYTEHNLAHVTHVLNDAVHLLQALHYDEHIIELTKIACFMHDIGNALSRYQHNMTGGLLATNLLQNIGFPIEDICLIANAICSHDSPPGFPTTPIAAALILGDKSDVRRSRVRKLNLKDFDIHDKVNYSILHSSLTLQDKTIVLTVQIDTTYSTKLDFYEIFLDRMLLCREAANILGCEFYLDIAEV